jgi:tetratricopeptide (TPR) repeat protein
MCKFLVFISSLLMLLATTLSTHAGLTSVDGSAITYSKSSQEKLEPARQEMLNGNLERCRELVSLVVKEVGDLPAADVIVALWLQEFGEMQLSFQLLEQLSQREPNRGDLHFAYAELARRSGRTFDAWTHLAAAEAAEPQGSWSDGYAQEFKHTVLLSKAHVAELRSDWKTATALLNRLKDAGVAGTAIELGLGNAAFRAGELNAAESHFRAAAEMDPAQVIPELLMAKLLAAEQKQAEAEAWFLNGQANNSLHSEQLKLEYALWLLGQQRAPEAMKLARAAAADSKFADSFALVRGLALYMYQRYEDAELELSKLSQKNPNDVRISNQLALALVESADEGKRARALQIAIANMKALPASADVASTLAWVQFKLGDPSAAQQTTAAVLARGGKLSRDSAYFLAQVLVHSQQHEQAQLLLETTRNSHGEFFNARRLAATVTDLGGQPSK